MDKNQLLAYETGYHLGDGHIQVHNKSRTNRIVYCGDSRKDAEFCGKILPKIIWQLYKAHFIRGLADADFSLTFKKNRKGVACEPRIEYFTNNKVLAKFVHKKLKELGFKPAFEDAFSHNRYKEYRIRMYGKAMLEKWMVCIGFQNPKHLRKIKLFKKLGFYVDPSSSGNLYCSL